VIVEHLVRTDEPVNLKWPASSITVSIHAKPVWPKPFDPKSSLLPCLHFRPGRPTQRLFWAAATEPIGLCPSLRLNVLTLFVPCFPTCARGAQVVDRSAVQTLDQGAINDFWL